MGKLLVILIAVAVAIWWLSGRRGPLAPPAAADKPVPPPPAKPQAMLACAHCGLHLPREDTVPDAAGRPFCSEAHRLAGPRPPSPG